jgi:F-type H+-transporting ATPase subunit gamma
MAAGKEIRNKIKSVENTRKITKAMEMVAASKMRKAQDRMKSSRPYSEKIKSVVGHLSQSNPDFKHPFLKENNDAKKGGIIVVSTDKGLCGGLNTNVFRQVLTKIREIESDGREIEALAIGNKAVSFLSRIDVRIVSSFSQLGDSPNVEELNGAIKIIIDEYKKGNLNEVHLFYNNFINTMSQEPIVEKLLPLSSKDLVPINKYLWDYLYEPDAPTVINDLLLRYTETLVYQAVVENIASEQSARMVAMKAATDNAGNVIDELKLIYNKTRQAGITKELSEIVAGAAAV